MAVFAMLVTAWKVPNDVSQRERPRNDYPGMIVLTAGLVALMIVVYQGQAWGWSNIRTLGLAASAVLLLGIFSLVERRAPEGIDSARPHAKP
jgi:hypothetical protein